MVAVVRTFWSGTSGGPGLTQHVISGGITEEWNPGGAQSAANAVRAFWDSLKTYLPNELILTVSPTIDYYDTVSGDLLGSVSAPTAPVTVAGTGSGVYAGGAGAKILWETGQVRNGRRVRGSTYLVPMDSIVFSNVGTINAGAKAAINTAATGLINALNTANTPLMVWSRPREATETQPQRFGAPFQVLSGSCSTKSAILRGRRD